MYSYGYRFVDGNIFELTLEIFLDSDPSLTEDDFRHLKLYSDWDYLVKDRTEYRQTWKNISMDSMPETVESPDSSPEEMIIDIPEEQVRKLERAALAIKIWKRLSDNQRRRFLMYHVQNMTEEQIAATEGVSHQAISKNLLGTDRKIRKLQEKQNF